MPAGEPGDGVVCTAALAPRRRQEGEPFRLRCAVPEEREPVLLAEQAQPHPGPATGPGPATIRLALPRRNPHRTGSRRYGVMHLFRPKIGFTR
jgi:hypothetical protein